jgi:hypothetical protein
MTDPVQKRLQTAILEVVERQLLENEPPITRETYDRLLKEGFSETEARRLIGQVVAAEFFEVLGKGRRYDEQAFAAKLRALPRAPWEKGASSSV